MVNPIIALFLLPAAFAASAQTGEDSIHKADRERTEALNRDVAASVARRTQTNADRQESYKAATAQYERQLREWRRRADACRAGYWDACG